MSNFLNVKPNIPRQKSEKTLKVVKNIDSSDSTDYTKNEAKLNDKVNIGRKPNPYIRGRNSKFLS